MKATIINKNGTKRKATKKETKKLSKIVACKLILTATNEIMEWKKFIKDIEKRMIK
jgi:hypothetical protein